MGLGVWVGSTPLKGAGKEIPNEKTLWQAILSSSWILWVYFGLRYLLNEYMCCFSACLTSRSQRMVDADVQPMRWRSNSWLDGGHLIMQFLGTQQPRRDAANLIICIFMVDRYILPGSVLPCIFALMYSCIHACISVLMHSCIDVVMLQFMY